MLMMKTLSIKQFIVFLSILLIHSIAYSQVNVPTVVSVWDGVSGLNGKYPIQVGETEAVNIPATFGSVNGISGDGSESNPYLITNASEFAFLSKKVNSGTTYQNSFFKLTISIDLNFHKWDPIGDQGEQFSGMFDGNNLIIKNIYIDRPDKINGAIYPVGLFGIIGHKWGQSKDFGVKNIVIEGGSIRGYQHVGGIVGEVKNDVNASGKPIAIIDNSYNISVTVSSPNDNLNDYSGRGNNVGGISGKVSGYVKINNCLNFANISGFSYVGGIVGDSDYSKSLIDYVAKVSNCINFGSISSIRGKIGGIVGDNGNIIELCSNHGKVDGGTALYEVGGVAGFNNCIVRECFNVGRISGYGVVGGIVGGMSNTTKDRIYPSELSDCYNVGDVIGIDQNIGGIVGRVNSTDNPTFDGVIHRVYNVGAVSGAPGKCMGEIIGEFINGTNVDVKECYYDNQFGRVLKAFGVGKVEPDNASKDTRSMIGAATLFGLAETWQYQENNYPILKHMMTNTNNYRYAEISTLAVILAKPTTRWNAIDDNFAVSTSFGATWRSGNVDIVNMHDGLATITPKGGRAILIASVEGIERAIPVETIPNKDDLYTTSIKINGYGKMIGQGKVLTSGHNISVISGGVEYIDIIPEDGYCLSSLIFTKIADVSGNRIEVKEHENKDGIGRNLNANYAAGYLHYKLEAIEGFTNTEIEATFSPIAKWDGVGVSDENKPYRDGQTNSYLIYKPSELVWAAKNIESAGGTGKPSVKLVNHLDMGGLSWMSIKGITYSFGGIFDGNMKTISNLNMSITLDGSNSTDNCGFIKVLEAGGEVSNLGLIGLTNIDIKCNNDIETTVNAGILVGENKGIIRDCYAIANILVNSNKYSKANIGGLVGLNNGGKVEYSYAVVPIQCSVYNENVVDGEKNMYIGGAVGNSINGGELKYIRYDNQMCAEKLAVGNISPNNDYYNGLETSLMTNALTVPTFNEFNTSGVWISLPGYYPMYNLSQNNLAVKVSASPILLAQGETTGNMRISNDGVKSNFSLWAPKPDTNNEITWSVETAYPVNPLTISAPYNGVSIAQVNPLTAQTLVTLLVSVKNTNTSEEIKCKRVQLMVASSSETKEITILIIGDSTDDKIESGGVDGTEAAKTPVGAKFSFGTGSTSEITLIPAPGRYLSSLISKPLINSPETEWVNVLEDVTVNYARGTLIYRVANITADRVLTATFSDVPSWTGGNSMIPHTYQNTQYLIYHPDELAWMSKAVNNDGNNFIGCSFKLMNDINLNNGDYSWISIGGHGDVSKMFKGSFNGNNLTIKNITINAPDKNYVGLFGHLDMGSKIWDLTLSDCKIHGNNYVGAIVGYFNMERFGSVDSNIDNCRIEISKDNIITDYYVKGRNNVGGIVGYGEHGTIVKRSHNDGIAVTGKSPAMLETDGSPLVNDEGINIGGITGFNDGIVNECTNSGTIKGFTNVGGIVGFNRGLRGESYISSCMNYGDVIGIGSQIGGISGSSDGEVFKTSVTNCININGKITGGNIVAGIVGHNKNAEVYMCYNMGGDVTALGINGEGIAGGIVAYNNGKVLSYSFNTGMITGISSVGGIAGKGSGASVGGVSYCFNMGIVKGDSYVGGIVGGTFGKISQCYNAGDIKGRIGDGLNAIHNVGAISGYPNEYGVHDCFYDKQMVAVNGINNIDTDEAKGYLTSEIINDKKGFKDKSAWIWAGDQVGSEGQVYPALYPSLKAWYPLWIENYAMQPILLKSNPSEGETTSNYEHVRWTLSDIGINGIEKEIVFDGKTITTLTSEPNIITFEQNDVNVKGTFKRTNEDQTVTIGIGTGVLVSDQPLRKVELTILQGDQFRKVFKGTGNWTDEPTLITESGWFEEILNAENIGTGVYTPTKMPTANENVVIDGHVTIKDGVKAVSGNTAVNPNGSITIEAGAQLRANRMRNTDVNNLKIFNDGNKSASFILDESSSVKPYMTLTQTIETGGIDDKYKYQLISIPIPTVPEGKPVVDIFKDAWLDRYNQSDAIWERYEEIYHGKRWFNIERFRGYSINFEEPSRNLIFKGQLYAEEANYIVSYSEHIANDGKNYGGLNLIGNPYTTAMKVNWDLLDAYTKNQVENNIWIWNGTQYMTYPGNVGDVIGDGIIPACQGFWIRVNPLIVNSGESAGSYPQTVKLSFPYAETVSENNTGLHKSDQNSYLPFIRLKVDGNRYSDELAIIESDNCSALYDNGWDGEKWLGIAQAPQFYSVEDRILAVNSKNDISETVLGFIAGEDSQYTISPISSTNIKDLKLVDLKMGISHDILNSPYTFTASKSDAANRFILKAASTKGVEDGIDNENWCKVFSYEKMK